VPEHLDQLFGLHGKVALVTGARAGMWRWLRKALGHAGADVAVVDDGSSRFKQSPKTLEAFGVRAPFQADLRDEAQYAALQQAQENLGPY